MHLYLLSFIGVSGGIDFSPEKDLVGFGCKLQHSIAATSALYLTILEDSEALRTDLTMN
jgi:hypothetical protein